jgi:hypothetical protein
MAAASNDYIGLLRDFMQSSQFKERFNRPLHIVERNLKEFSLFGAIRRYLDLPAEYGLRLSRRVVPEDSRMLGLLLDYEDRAEILYAHHLNPCYRRFVIAKELSQVLIDRSFTNIEDAVTTESTDLNKILMGISGMLGPQWLKDEISTSERVAMNFAQELMVPWFETEIIRQRAAEGEDLTEIARSYMAPRVIIEQRIDQIYDQNVEILKY